jgi:hypothetical protein
MEASLCVDFEGFEPAAIVVALVIVLIVSDSV